MMPLRRGPELGRILPPRAGELALERADPERDGKNVRSGATLEDESAAMTPPLNLRCDGGGGA